jgi:hypothetical protein
MQSIGLRADPNGFYWAATEGSLEVPILMASGHVEAPRGYDFPVAANFLRLRLHQLLVDHRIDIAGLRTPEMMGRMSESLRERIRIEGALLAACGEASIAVTQAALATLNRLLGTKAKGLLESPNYRGIDFEKMPTPKREAILMSASMLRSDQCKS